MALVPSVPSRWRDWWEDFDRTHRMIDLHFNRVLKRDDFFDRLALPPFDWYFWPWDRLLEQRVAVKTSTITTTSTDFDEFRVAVDVNQFSPREIIVKTIGHSIIIEAKHEEHKPDNSCTTTEFMRRYELPTTHDVNRVMCNLSINGILTITAPKFGIPRPRERIVPIDRIRFPAIKS